ncbi:MAG: ParB/RepB/Spo0J family partition protein, partial [Gammaproteobacteria bacterium]|nr:ParB/RepB/Spo0J family partition protein [Gammaproteobacteria bacterium]
MTKKKKSRLGKGLGALLGDVRQTTAPVPAESPDAAVPDPATATGLLELPVELLQRGRYQPRRNMDEETLEELADSIRSQGVIQPLLVRRLGVDSYEIVAGERRWRGAQRAGLATVPAVVREVSDEAAMAVALIENIQRQDLNAIEQAMGFQRLLEEFGLTHEEVADSVGRSRAAVTNTLRLLNLTPAVQRLVESGELEMGHARALLGLPEERQLEGARK